jgi:hypothetical protein
MPGTECKKFVLAAHCPGANRLGAICTSQRRISGAIDLHWSTRQNRNDLCHLTAHVQRTIQPRKGAKNAKRKELFIEDIMQLCDVVRETGFAIHRYHKHGHLEKVYENALAHRFRKLGLDVKQQHPIRVYDADGTPIGD